MDQPVQSPPPENERMQFLGERGGGIVMGVDGAGRSS